MFKLLGNVRSISQTKPIDGPSTPLRMCIFLALFVGGDYLRGCGQFSRVMAPTSNLGLLPNRFTHFHKYTHILSMTTEKLT